MRKFPSAAEKTTAGDAGIPIGWQPATLHLCFSAIRISWSGAYRSDHPFGVMPEAEGVEESAPALRFIYLFMMSFEAADHTMVAFSEINDRITCEWPVSPRSESQRCTNNATYFTCMRRASILAAVGITAAIIVGWRQRLIPIRRWPLRIAGQLLGTCGPPP